MSTSKHEQRILRALVDKLGAAGFKPAAVYIEDGIYLMPADAAGPVVEFERGKEPTNIARAMTADEVCDQVYKVYDTLTPTIHFTQKDLTTWGNRGVMIVVGNAEDLISDWHSADKSFDAILWAVAEEAGEQVYA